MHAHADHQAPQVHTGPVVMSTDMYPMTCVCLCLCVCMCVCMCVCVCVTDCRKTAGYGPLGDCDLRQVSIHIINTPVVAHSMPLARAPSRLSLCAAVCCSTQAKHGPLSFHSPTNRHQQWHTGSDHIDTLVPQHGANAATQEATARLTLQHAPWREHTGLLTLG